MTAENNKYCQSNHRVGFGLINSFQDTWILPHFSKGWLDFKIIIVTASDYARDLEDR
jgi:hypothetical protein